MLSNYITLIEWFSCGGLSTGIASSGVSCFGGDSWLGATYWNVATYTRDVINMESNSIGLREWRSFGSLGIGITFGGFQSLNINAWLGFNEVSFATI